MNGSTLIREPEFTELVVSETRALCRRNTCRASRRPLEIRRVRSRGSPAVATVRTGWSWPAGPQESAALPLLDLRQVALGTLASRASVFLDTSASSRWARRYLPGSASWPGARS